MEKTPLARKEHLHPSQLKGLFVPTLTPFKLVGHAYKLDIPSHTRQIKRLADKSTGVRGIFLGSNSGQGRDMDMDNLKLSIYTGLQASREVNPDLPVVVGALRTTIDEVLEVAKFAEESGADAIVIAPGYTEGALTDILDTVSQNTDLPVILYNNPGFQNKENLPLEFIAEAIKNPKVIGIKDTSGDPAYFEELLKLRSNNFHVMQGDTKAGLKKSIFKADGMVAAEANAYAERIAEFFHLKRDFYPKQIKEVLDYTNSYIAKHGGSPEDYFRHLLIEAKIFDHKDVAYPRFDRATQWWMAESFAHDYMLAINPNAFAKEHDTAFMAERLAGHQEANLAVINSIPAGETMVLGKLRNRILQLIDRNRQFEPSDIYPPKADIAMLNREQALKIYSRLLAHYVNNFRNESVFKKDFPALSPADVQRYSAEQLLHSSLEEEAEFTGFLLKTLDLYDRPRPKAMTKLYGDGEPLKSSNKKNNSLNYWLIEFNQEQTTDHQGELKNLLEAIDDAVDYANAPLYEQISDKVFHCHIGHNTQRSSSVYADLAHEVNNLIFRNIVVDMAVQSENLTAYPSPTDVGNLGRDELLSLYKTFTHKLTASFAQPDRFPKTGIQWWSNEQIVQLPPREFLLMTLDHLHLHHGSLTFMKEYLRQ